MKNNKKATNIEDQLEKLKTRGMIIDNEKKAKENLLDIGYYRLGFYWFPFEKTYPRKNNRTHDYNEGTKFDFAIKLYYFDFDFRNLLLRYISRIEINFRTRLIYLASNKYENDPFWYINPDIVNKEFIDSLLFQNALKDASKESNIKLDLKNHKRDYAPAWKLIEHLTFGVVIKLYYNIKDGELRHDISVGYGIQSPSQFFSYLNTVRRLRNYCAHGKVLFDMNLPEAISSGPLGDLKNRKTMLVGAYMVFKYLLGQVSVNRVTEMRTNLLEVFNRIPYQNVKDIIFYNTGLNIEDI